jgi:hypothetical protein
MLFPKCPKCGGKVEAKDTKVPGGHGTIHGARHVAEKVPVLGIAVGVGILIYQRVPAADGSNVPYADMNLNELPHRKASKPLRSRVATKDRCR